MNKNIYPKVGLGVLIFNSSEQILLGKRRNSHGEFSWAPPGGHLEFGESLEECAIREVSEETAVIIEEPKFLAVTNDIFKEEGKHYISIFMTAHIRNNQVVRNMEPDKTENWEWFSLDALPEHLFLPIKHLSLGLSYGQALDCNSRQKQNH